MQQVENSRDVLKRVPPITAKFFDPSPSKVDPSDLVLLAQEFHLCLKCGGELVLSNDDVREWVCRVCGHVWGGEFEEPRIPLVEDNVAGGHAEGSYSPITHLDWGGGLGGKNDTFSAADVLSDSGDMQDEVRSKLEEHLLVQELLTGKRVMVKNGKFRDPLNLRRASHVQVSLANGLLKELLTLGSYFCKRHGFHRSRDAHHLWFSDQVGINMIHVGRFYSNGRKNPFDTWRLGASIFCLLYRQCFPERYRSIRSGNNGDSKKFPELCLPDELLDYYGKVLQTCNPPVLPQLP